MKVFLFTISMIGLALTVVPSMFVFSEAITLEMHKQLMVAGMLLWFFSAPFWIKEQSLVSGEHD
ncbi:MAG: hypothetical protein WD038_01295 [Balneolales bacterium]